MSEQSARTERIEAEVMYETVAEPPDDARAATAISAVRTGEGVAVAVRDDPTDHWSKTSVPESCATGRRGWITRPLRSKARDDVGVLPG